MNNPDILLKFNFKPIIFQIVESIQDEHCIYNAYP